MNNSTTHTHTHTAKWILLLSFLLMFSSNLSAQNDFILTWGSQVGCLEYDDVDKRIALEDIEDGKCLKVCEGSIVRYALFYDEEDHDIEQINWDVQGGDILFSSQNSLEVVWPVAGEDAEVSVEIIMADGEVIQATLCIETKPKPEALFKVAGIDNDFFCEDTDLYFNSLSTTTDGSNIVSHLWDFGNGDFSQEENPVYSFDKAGEYEVTLTVSDECNCTSQYTQLIYISEPAYQIECPTVTCEDAIETYFIEINPESELDEVECERYNWSVDGGGIIDQEDNWVTVIWNEVDESGFGTVYFDQRDCNVECNSVLAVRIPVVQKQGTIQGGNTELCEGEQSVFSLPQWPTTDFQWTLIDELGTAYPNNTILVDQRNEIALDTEGLNSGTYTLKADYNNTLNSCNGSAEIEIEILENLEIDEYPETSCIENEVNFQLINTNASNAEWTIKHLNYTIATGTGNSFDYVFSQTGIHTISVNADGYCDTSSTIEIFDNPNFPVNTEIEGDNNICPNQMLSYTLSNVINNANIVWSVSNGQIIGPNQGDEVSVIFDEGSENYQVSAQLSNPNAENCLSSIITKNIDLFQVEEQIVDNANSPSTGPESYCASSIAEFSLNYQDSDTYVWTFDPPQLATVSAGIGTNNPSILFNEPFTDSSGNYINQGQIIVNAKVCGQMQEIDRFDFSLIESPTLTVNMPPEICAGTPFDVDITSSIELPGLSPQDVNISFENNFNNFNDVTINSTTSYTIHDIVLNNVDSDITIDYNISIDNDICNDAIASGTITVEPSPIADISLITGGNAFCQEDDIDSVLEVTVQNTNGNQTYQWLYNGSNISGETSNTLDIGNLNNSIYNFGLYSVEVQGANGCVTRASVYEIFENCEDVLPCENETISVTASWISCEQVEVTATYSGNPNLTSLNTTDSFSNVNATLESTQSSPGQITQVYNVDTNGNFKFKARAVYNDCFTEAITTAIVGYHPILNTEITCNDMGNGYDVILHNDSTLLDAFNNTNANYSITNTDTGQSIAIDPSDQDFNQAIATLPPANYEFTLSIQEPGSPLCEITEQVDLSLPDATFSISNSSPFCTEEQVTLSPTNPDPNVSYQWEFQGATNTLQDIVIQMDANQTNQITLTATNSYDCSSSFSIENLEVLKAEFSGQIIPQNPLICEGDSISLSYDLQPLESVSTYQWLVNGQEIQGATNSTFTASTEGLYSVKLTDTNGCLYEELAGVYVNIAPNPSLNIDGNTELCEGEELEFSGTVSPSNAEYQISIVQNGQPNIVQAWTSGPDISYTEIMQNAGVFEYLIDVKDNTTNCETSQTIDVTVLPSIEPQIDIQLDQCEAYSVTLTITNPQPDASYTWSNGMQGTSINVDKGGAYSVTYQPQSGCSTVANVFVPKSPDEFLWVFPDGCIDFCWQTVDDRFGPVPYIIGPIPEFYPYSWGFNNNSIGQNGLVSDYVLGLSDGVLNLSLTNDLGCVSTSADLNVDIDYECDVSCNIEFDDQISTANSNNNFISYDITGTLNNNNNFAITLTFTSFNGVYIPNTVTIPANSSVSFSSTNPLIFIPDVGFTGNSDFVQVMGQQAGDAFCIQEIEITYNSSQSNARAILKASKNPVKQRTEVIYEFLNMDKLQNAQLEVYSAYGHFKNCIDISNIKGQKVLDLSTYTSGQYIVVLKHGGKIVEQLILIKE